MYFLIRYTTVGVTFDEYVFGGKHESQTLLSTIVEAPRKIL